MHSAAAVPRKLTYRDYLKFPDDGQRHELIDGVHYVTPTPVPPHQIVIGNLYYLIREHLESHKGGQVFLSPLTVVLSLFDVVEPDLLFISDARMAILTRKHVQGGPNLAIEVLSPSTRRRDESLKLKLYERFNAREYWVVDPTAEVVRIYRRKADRLQRAREIACADGDVLTSPLLPGMALSLDRVFERPPGC